MLLSCLCLLPLGAGEVRVRPDGAVSGNVALALDSFRVKRKDYLLLILNQPLPLDSRVGSCRLVRIPCVQV